MRDTGQAARLLTDPRTATGALNCYRAARVRRRPYRFAVLSGSHRVADDGPCELAALVLEHLAAHPVGS